MSRLPTRRQILLAGPALAAAGLGWGLGVEPRWVREDRRRIRLEGLRGSVRLLHLADLHRSRAVGLRFLRRAVERGLGWEPDLVCLTGDFVTAGSRADLAGYAEVLARLARRAPTYAVLGNHDGGLWSRSSGGEATTDKVTALLAAAGVEVLDNRSVVVDLVDGSCRLRLVGLADLWSGGCDPAAAFAGSSERLPTILLAHNPDSKDLAADHDWNLMLSGHTHGGQVVVPLVGPPFAPVQDRRYVAGLNAWGERWIYTTRGVGNIAGVRFNCRPEISLLELVG